MKVPADARAGAVVSVDARGLTHPYVTVAGAEYPGPVHARSVSGRAMLGAGSTGWGGRVVGPTGDRFVLILSGESAGRNFRLVPTPVHPQTLTVGGGSIRVPADPNGLHVLVMIDPAGALYAEATVHEGPSHAWHVAHGFSFLTPTAHPCASIERCQSVTISRYGKSGGGPAPVYGRGVGMLLSTGGYADEGYFEVSLTEAAPR